MWGHHHSSEESLCCLLLLHMCFDLEELGFFSPHKAKIVLNLKHFIMSLYHTNKGIYGGINVLDVFGHVSLANCVAQQQQILVKQLVLGPF